MKTNYLHLKKDKIKVYTKANSSEEVKPKTLVQLTWTSHRTSRNKTKKDKTIGSLLRNYI